jgi:hypothetical protein
VRSSPWPRPKAKGRFYSIVAATDEAGSTIYDTRAIPD